MARQSTPDYEDVSPYLLLRELPEIASNKIPTCMETYCERSGLKPWELLEESVFYFFRQILMLETVRMGAQSLFRHEPEGVALINRDPHPFAIMYECKARTDPYIMSSDDVLRYKDYIRRQRREIKERQHLDLTHFVIVSSDFASNVNDRLHDIESEGVVTCMIPAKQLRIACNIIRDLEFSDIQLFDLRQLFRRGVVNTQVLQRCFGQETVSFASTTCLS